jgi:hypothetical protein
MSEAGDVSDEDLVRPEAVPVWASRRRWVIHFPAVVCTSSPSTTRSVFLDADETLSVGTLVFSVFGFGELFRELVKLGL